MKKHFRMIVGGRSSAYEGLTKYPRGIEILLKKAKVDGGFQKLLLRNPLAAAASIELSLQENERKILANTPKAVLNSKIQNTFVPKQQVRTFLTRKAPAMAALLLATTVVLTAGGGEPVPEGVTADDMVQYETEEATDKVAVLQSGLEQYKLEYGEYLSTEQWLAATWVAAESGEIVNYFLESLGLDPDDPEDNIPCPIEPEIHRFPM